MGFAAQITALAQSGLSFMDYLLRFCSLAVTSTYDDETYKSLFWIEANYHHPYPFSTSMNRVLVQSQCYCRFGDGSTDKPSKNRGITLIDHVKLTSVTFTSKLSQSSSPTSAGCPQPFVLPRKALLQCEASGRATTSLTRVRRSCGYASDPFAPPRTVGFALAPPTLCSTRYPRDSTEFPRPTGFSLVSPHFRHGLASLPLRSVSPPLRFQPLSLWLGLCHTDSTSVLVHSGFTLSARHCTLALVFRACGVTRRLSVSLGSTSNGSSLLVVVC
ncbi:hypothetical protein DPX16_5158 [Anabarilius grahami]|uniref:Uncharacterized protein n=1 Tax=Anabarilius grahami TaxID=495550 RepID=A0A3N0XL40_ANAGA|nr:hypothetical protein DPX16_5158 [Anabarilius grahami]